MREDSYLGCLSKAKRLRYLAATIYATNPAIRDPMIATADFHVCKAFSQFKNGGAIR